MKLLECVLIFGAFLICSEGKTEITKNILKPSKSNSNLVESVNKITNEILTREYVNTNIVTPEHPSFAASDFKNGLLSKSFETARALFRHDQSPNITASRLRRKHNNMFLIKTFDDFSKIYMKLSRNIFQFNGFYVVVLVNGEIPEIEQILELMWKIQVYNVVVMFEEENDTVLVKTFRPFNSGNCFHTTPVLINTFKNGRFINGIENIFPQKMNNLHKCPMRVAVANNVRPEVFVKQLPDGSNQCSGRSIELIESVAETLNFEVNYTYIGPEGFLYENGTAEGPLKAVLDGKADFTISNWWLKEKRLKFLDASLSYISSPLHFVVPPEKDYTALEKLAVPFNHNVWIPIITLKISMFLIILILKLFPSPQKILFGTDVRHPYMNMIIGFLGGSQHTLPRRNFTRFLLMTFLLYSLVVRTVYQGLYYQFLQSNRHHKGIESIKQMIEENFTFYIFNGGEDMLMDLESNGNRSDCCFASEILLASLKTVNY